MANRATKSGLSADIQKKIGSKYECDCAEQCMRWIKDIIEQNSSYSGPTNTCGDQDNVHQQLKDGLYLARVANVIIPGSVNASKLKDPPKLAFKQMELIGLFLTQAKNFGLPDSELFQTVDLFEQTNLHQVVICLSATARKAQSKGMVGFGPKESEANVRNFSEDQLKAGQNVIGLQMGSNKGASQAGQSFGRTRHIVD